MFLFPGSLELSAEGKGQYFVYLHSAWGLDPHVSYEMFMSKEKCQVTDYSLCCDCWSFRPVCVTPHGLHGRLTFQEL